jgi:serine/threonine protein phosphatase PrpC
VQPFKLQKAIRKVDDQVAQFAYLTRAGRNHERVTKTNQDNFFVVKNFAKIENLWFFGVADGHG